MRRTAVARDWLILEDAQRDPAVSALFDRVVAQVEADELTPRDVDTAYPRGFVADGRKILGSALMDYGLRRRVASEFDAAEARAFTERMRGLLGWYEISSTLRLWAESRLCGPYFVNEGSEWDQNWVLRADADPTQMPADFLVFACYIAIGELKYGPSYAHVSANRIFGWVTGLGSDLPAQLRKHGTGELPKELADFRGDGVSAKANDALAVVRIVVKEESEQAYGQALDYLVRLLTTTDFPRTYAVEFRGPTKTYLPIRGLPKKGVHQLFASAVGYPALHPLIEQYARAAMHEYSWYQNLDDVNCAMPGTFAVFALAFAGAENAPLVLDYLGLVDGEHQSMHGLFVEAYIDARGFTPEALAYLIAVAGNIQHLRHRKTYPALIADRAPLETLLHLRATRDGTPPSSIAALRANLIGDTRDDPGFRAARFTIWGERAERERGKRLIASAPEELRELYQEVFTDAR
ncbi:DUF6138 family protein [Microbacterium sp. ZW T5_56]|uniref:DUF6138 family protein n=1 Tax=Microbacterium sp. ZW T5_56 TaxID=3378081 RepID=UPI003853DA4D